MDKIILNILKKIEKNGYEAYVVGVYVRNELHFNKEETKLEDKATTLIKTNKKVS